MAKEDWQEYSLKAFEREWLNGAMSFGALQERTSMALWLLARSSLRDTRTTRTGPLIGGSPSLGRALNAEARSWHSLGRYVGYFPDRDLQMPGTDNDIDPEFFYTSFERAAAENSGALTPATFGMWLAEAREDLTPARIRFLELLLFARPDVWERELDRVKRLGDLLIHRPWVALPSSTVDLVSWALSGAELESSRQRTPAFWRTNVRALSEPAVPGVVPDSVERWAALRRTRAPIKAAMEWLVDDERGPHGRLDLGSSELGSGGEAATDPGLGLSDE